MQQNGYMNHRYWGWLQMNFAKYRRSYIVSLILAVCFIFLLVKKEIYKPFIEEYWYGIYAVWIINYTVEAILILREKQKKKLVFTKRAIRLLIMLLLLYGLILIPIFLLINQSIILLSLVIIYSISPAIIISSNFLLIPLEKEINKWYYQDAVKILTCIPKLQIIGITGSYGKTSVKNFLTNILSERFNVLMTPESYNTTMGVIKTIRNHLKPIHEIFVVEMGAKRIGDIKEICDLVKPNKAVLTAIGPQHLESFGNLSNIKKTKFELIDALPKNGLAILNADYQLIKDQPLQPDIQPIYYSTNEIENGYYAKNIICNSRGMSFTIYRNKEEILTLSTRLLGKHNILNILAACIVASSLGMDWHTIAYAIRKLKPVTHRLSIRNTPSGITIIDDAFNANLEGAKAALEVLKNIDGNKKIIITPGMIELGKNEYQHNKIFGKLIAKICDYAILVGKKQTQAIKDGLEIAAYPKNKYYLSTDLTDANRHLKQIIHSGDIVLYENDLPDIYNE